MLLLAYAFLAAIFSTLFALLARKLGIVSEHPRAYSVIFEISSAFFSLLLIAIEPLSFRPIPVVILVLTLLSTLCYGVSDRLLFFINKSIEASSLTVIDKLVPVVIFLASIFLLGESITPEKVLAVLLIGSGNLLVLYKNSAIKLNKGFTLALIAVVCFGLALTIDKKASVSYSLPIYSFITYMIPAFYNAFLPPLPFSIIACEFKRASWKILLLAAMNVLSYFFTLKAFSIAEASTVIPIINSSTIFIILAGAIFLNERSHISMKVVAGICWYNWYSISSL